MLKRKVSALTLALGMLLLPISASAAGTQTDSAAAEITIYHTNDTHGYLTGDGESIVGLSTAAGLKAASPDAILVDAGDALQGLPIASLTKGNDVVELMNLAGYDLMVPGNHEFDFGTEAFLTNVELADFPILSANIYQDGHLLLEGLQENNPGCKRRSGWDGYLYSARSRPRSQPNAGAPHTRRHCRSWHQACP